MDADTLTAKSPALPAAVLYPATALLTFILCVVLLRTKSSAARFVIFACWFRYIFSAFHTVTFSASPIGISWNALASILICLLGIAVLKQRRLWSPFFLPIYGLMAIIIVSGAFNGEYPGLLNNVAKFGYLAVVCAGVAEAMEDLGGDRFLKALLWSFSPPLVFQFLSLALDVPKASELDGSASFIGGYNHEAVFSIVIATCFVVTALNATLRRSIKGLLLAATLAGILLANYRTTILAIAPLVFVQLTAGISHLFKKGQREGVFMFFLAFSVLAFGIVAWTAQDRFGDIGVVWEKGTNIIQPPERFSPDERRLLSARPYLWSQYIYGYKEGSEVQHWIGLGPDSWASKMPTYAHNTLVSYLYEYGILGVAAILLLWIAMFRAALRVRGSRRTKLLAAHASFFLLNMATMPHWQIEGNILYGILCGYTLALTRRRPAERTLMPQMQGTLGGQTRTGAAARSR